MQFLRKNTATEISVGPFVDATDGVTTEDALTISNLRITLVAETDDDAAPTLVLNDATASTSGDNALNYITSQNAGMMQMALTGANINRNGRMTLIIRDNTDSNNAPVFQYYMVLPQMIYDSFISGTADLEVDAQKINDTAVLGTGTASDKWRG